MRLRFIKILSVFFCFVAIFSLVAVKAFANPTISGKVVLKGTGAGLPNIWVKWMEDYGTPYQSAYRFVQTNGSGIFSFEDLSTMSPGQENKLLGNPIDTNIDGANDDVEMFVDSTKPIPGYPGGASEFFHFNGANSPHAFTAVVPSGLSGTFNIVGPITINDADASLVIPDIEFTPSAVVATPTPAPIYTISGNVFNDDNKNAIIDPGEKGYSGAIINLSGDANATVTSDANGDYSFKNLAAGTYTVAIVVPVGYSVTTASSSNINLTKNQTVNFGLAKAIVGAGCTASITGTVYNDLNWNGNADPGETPISGWTVHLSALGLAVPLTTTTNASGVYTFTGLCTNIFTITQTVLPPWFSTKSLSIVMTVIDGENKTNINFFDAQKFTIDGHAFLDSNGDGIITAGSTGYQGVAVILTGTTASGLLFLQATTLADGSYSFSNLPVGSYKLLFVQVIGYRSTTANAENIDLINNRTIDYGLTPESNKKSGGACNNTTLDIVLVIDHSGSMSDNDSATGIPKIDEAIAAANGFVDVIMQNLPTAKIGVVQFSNSSGFDINNVGDSYSSSLLLPLTGDVNQLKTTISNISTDSSTCVQCGVQLANKALDDSTRPNSQKIIILLTDGMANNIVDDPGTFVDTDIAENAAMDDIMDGINKQTIIYDTIGLGLPGNGANNIDEPFLKAVAETNWGSYYNDPTIPDLKQIFSLIASAFVPTGSITGMVYEDKDPIGGVKGPEDTTPIQNMPIVLNGANLPNPMTTTSDSSGNYGFYGLCDSNGKNYTVTQSTMSPWLLTTTGTYTIPVAGGAPYKNNNFGNRYGYQISGSVFNDIDKNKIKDAGDLIYSGGITISPSSGTATIDNATGTYTITALSQGDVMVTYAPIPGGFNLIYPGPPASFIVHVGPPGCNVNGSLGAVCDGNGNITNLNFAISNSIPWIQTYGLDMRFDNGFTNMQPAATSCGGGSYASGTTVDFGTPGIVFSGDSSSDFGQGSASSANWVVGGMTYPEVFESTKPLRTSTQSLLGAAAKAGVTLNSLSTVCNPADCNLPINLTKGIYYYDGDVHFKQPINNSFLTGNTYIFIAENNHDIYFENNASVTVPVGAIAFFAAARDIKIDPTIHALTNTCSSLPAGQLQGIFSADRNIIVEGINNCVVGSDKMLNVEGTFVVNAAQLNGTFQKNRDLCGDNLTYPSITIKARPDFILHTPGFMTEQNTISHEEVP